jgi:soluble lytic murein transglycosylase
LTRISTFLPLVLASLATNPVVANAALARAAVIERAPANSERSVAPASEVPEAARRALAEKRYFHATLLLREYMASVSDTTAEALLLAARAEAGWGDWENVERLLAGRPWLDAEADALGWNLLGRSQYELGKWEAGRRALQTWLEKSANASATDRGMAELFGAHAAREAGDEAGALAGYDRAAALLEPVRDWVGLQAVAAAAATGDTAEVERRLARMDEVLAREWGWRHRVRAYRNASDMAGAASAAERSASQLSAASRRAEALVELGTIRFNSGDVAGAREAFRRALQASPGSGSGIDGARMLSEMPGLSPEDRLLIGRTYLRHGNAQRGVDGVQAYLDAGRGSAAEREQLRYEIAQALFGAARYDESERILLGIARRNIQPTLAADALHLAARSQYRDGRITLARRTFLDVAAKYPDKEAAARATFIVADLDHDDGDLDDAVARFRRVTQLSPDAEEVGLAHMRLGGIAYQKEDWTAARQEFDRYRTAYPNGRRYVQATYWAGLSNRKLGLDSLATARFEEVLRLDPFSYYGGLAAELLGRHFWDIPLNTSPATDSATAAAIDAALVRLDLLREMEWNDAAGYVVDRIRDSQATSVGARYYLAEALNERGFTTIGIAMGWDLFRQSGGWNDRLLRIIYPFPFRDVILAETEERGVDPFLTAALIRQESMFNPEALSRVGAVGLMQVMPTTGQALARQLGIRRFERDMLTHAELNVHLGIRYLADQLSSFQGRLPVVLAAYNAGPQRIDRWQEFPEFGDDELFAERIPFAETRDYVKIVQNNARLYESLYKPLIQNRRTATERR